MDFALRGIFPLGAWDRLYHLIVKLPVPSILIVPIFFLAGIVTGQIMFLNTLMLTFNVNVGLYQQLDIMLRCFVSVNVHGQEHVHST